MDPINVTIQPPAELNVSVGATSELDVSVEVGTPGPQGERGATFLGGYPSLSNLPVIDGVNVKDGDFALVKDTSTVYQIKP